MKEIKMVNKSYDNHDNRNNEIIAEIDLDKLDEKKIQIINSYENVKRCNRNKNLEEDYKYLNENEIKESTEIKINGKSIQFSYYYKFEKEGKYQIKYIFKKLLNKTNHIFFDCEFLRKLDLSELDTENITIF